MVKAMSSWKSPDCEEANFVRVDSSRIRGPFTTEIGKQYYMSGVYSDIISGTDQVIQGRVPF